jgi:hypothetical protein
MKQIPYFGIFFVILYLFTCSNNPKAKPITIKSKQIIDVYQNMQHADSVIVVYSDSSKQVILTSKDTSFNVVGKTNDYKWLLVSITPGYSSKGKICLFWVPKKKIITEKELGLDSTWTIWKITKDNQSINILSAKNDLQNQISLKSISDLIK